MNGNIYGEPNKNDPYNEAYDVDSGSLSEKSRASQTACLMRPYEPKLNQLFFNYMIQSAKQSLRANIPEYWTVHYAYQRHWPMVPYLAPVKYLSSDFAEVTRLHEVRMSALQLKELQELAANPKVPAYAIPKKLAKLRKSKSIEVTPEVKDLLISGLGSDDEIPVDYDDEDEFVTDGIPNPSTSDILASLFTPTTPSKPLGHPPVDPPKPGKEKGPPVDPPKTSKDKGPPMDPPKTGKEKGPIFPDPLKTSLVPPSIPPSVVSPIPPTLADMLGKCTPEMFAQIAIILQGKALEEKRN